MKRIFILLMIPMSTLTAVAQTKKAVAVKKHTVTRKNTAGAKTAVSAFTAKNTLDSASYAFGTAMASSLKSKGLTTLNYTLMLKGMKDRFNGNKLMITDPASQRSINNLFEQTNKAKFAGNIADGKTFLENNKKITGVKTTSSGLQYMVLKEGNGIRPQSTDTVLVNYKGTLLNGKQFDSSYDRNEPLSIPLNKAIQGWMEGLPLMSQGAKYKLFIPYNLAYGERGAGEDIPPYSTLIFEVELLKINGK